MTDHSTLTTLFNVCLWEISIRLLYPTSQQTFINKENMLIPLLLCSGQLHLLTKMPIYKTYRVESLQKMCPSTSQQGGRGHWAVYSQIFFIR